MTKQDFQTLTQNVVLLDGATGSNLMLPACQRVSAQKSGVLAHKDVFQAPSERLCRSGEAILSMLLPLVVIV